MSAMPLPAEAMPPDAPGGIRAAFGRQLRDLHWWAGALLSGAGLVVVGLELGRAGLAQAAHAAPANPVFWLVFAMFYLTAPTCEWVIFRRLWRLPAAGFSALLRKYVANELVLGYSGEAQFYLWARKHVRLDASPFAAVKDCAVLSAVGGNIATLAFMAANRSVLAPVLAGPLGHAFVWSAGAVALSSLAMFVFRRRLFSLGRPQLAMIFAIQAMRIFLSTLLLGLLWHLLLPALPLAGLMTLATMRLMLSRLPLLPAKDVAFAGLVAALLGASAPVVPAVLLVGSLVIVAHLGVALCVIAVGMLQPWRRRSREPLINSPMKRATGS